MRLFYEEQLDKGEMAWNLVREWCGERAVLEREDVKRLAAEVQRLRQLVQSVAAWIRDIGHPVKTNLILRELGGVQLEKRARSREGAS